MRKTKLLLLCLFTIIATLESKAQDRTISGKIVSSKDGSSLAGATVSIKGTRSVAVGADGSFSITAPSTAVVLTVSNVGFLTKDVNVGANENNITITLDESSTELEQVVVTALGITRREKSLVYATQKVKTSELVEARDPNNVLNSLQGKVANAFITQGSGGPGSGARIVLRGNRSIQGNNNALIVVDGVPISNGTNGTATSDFGAVQGSDGASNLNPDDIESMNILRGASAAALYGSQAGNGVIVITTKKGKAGKLSVTLNSGVTIESAFTLPNMQNQYGQGQGGILDPTIAASWGPKMTGQTYTNFLGEERKLTPQPDNIKDFFRDGVGVNNSIGITSGSEKMQSYLSYTNNYIQGIVPDNDLIRNTFNFRIGNQISPRLSTDAKITYINQQISNRPRTGEENAPTIDIYSIARNMALSDAKQFEYINNIGLPSPTPYPLTQTSIYQNPYWMINRTAINEDRDRIIGFLMAKYQITDWLSISGRGNIDKIMDRGEQQYSNETTLWGRSGGEYSKNNITVTEKWADAMLEGTNSLTSDLSITYRAGAIYQDRQYDANYSSAGGLNIANKFSMNFAKGPSVSSSFQEVQTQSIYGQVNLNWKDAIFLDASLRNDWDSRLPEPHSFSYPSVGASAILTELFKLPASISFLKASINYAEVGNGGQFGLLTPTYTYSQGAGSGFLQISSTVPIPGLKPELVKNFEAGVEARFTNNRYGIALTYYKSNSTNQLLTVALPPATGFSSQYINAGDIQNQGFEVVIDASPIRNSNFTWDLNFNFSLNRNKVVELSPDVKSFALGGGFGRSATPIIREGESYGDLLALRWATDAKGDHIVTADGKPVATQAQEYIGNFYPKELLGLTNTFNYKGFHLRFLIDGRIGGTVVSGTEMNLSYYGLTEATLPYREGGLNLGGVDASGNPVSQTIDASAFWKTVTGGRYGWAEFFAYDATSFRLRELTFGYTIPLSPNIFVKSLKVNIVGRNLFWLYRGSTTLDVPGLPKRKMWFDPDLSLGNANWQGVEYGNLPATRSFGLNIVANF